MNTVIYTLLGIMISRVMVTSCYKIYSKYCFIQIGVLSNEFTNRVTLESKVYKDLKAVEKGTEM